MSRIAAIRVIGSCCHAANLFSSSKPPSSTKGWIWPLSDTLSSNLPPPPLPIEGPNFSLWPHPNWSVITGHTSAVKLPSKSGCRLYMHLPGWELFQQSCWEWGTDKFSPAISQNALNGFRNLYSCFVVVFTSFSQNFPLSLGRHVNASSSISF